MFRMDNWKCSMGALVFAAFMAQPAAAQEIYIGVYGGGGGVNLDGTTQSRRTTGYRDVTIDLPRETTADELALMLDVNPAELTQNRELYPGYVFHHEGDDVFFTYDTAPLNQDICRAPADRKSTRLNSSH